MPAKGQRRKQQIIETAKDMFMTQGFQSSHIGQVCDRLNIARGTVYQYFGNKREILYAILDDIEEQMNDIFDIDDLNDFMKANSGKDVINGFLTERLTNCIRALISEPIVIRLIFKEIVGIDQEVIDYTQKFIDTVSKIISRDIEEIRQKGYYRKSLNPAIITTLIIGGVLFFVHDCERHNKDPLARETLVFVVDSLLNGMA